MSIVNTVLGPISPEQMGKTLPHEHFIYARPGYQSDISADPYQEGELLNASIAVAEYVHQCGFQTMIDMTPSDCGRDPLMYREIAQRTGLNIICATGTYTETLGASFYFTDRSKRLGTDLSTDLYQMMKAEIEQGIGNTGIKAGAIKVGTGAGAITAYEDAAFRAAARAGIETGTPIFTHTEQGTMGVEQAELFLRQGVDPKKAVIGHMCGDPNLDHHLKILDMGFWVAFDCWGDKPGGTGATRVDEDIRTATALELLKRGYGPQLLFSQDSLITFLGRRSDWDLEQRVGITQKKMTHVQDFVIPRLLAAGVSPDILKQIVEENPMRLYAG